MLLSGLVFIGWVFSTLVSAFSLVLRMDVGSVCYLVGNFSGVLVDVATPSLAGMASQESQFICWCDLCQAAHALAGDSQPCAHGNTAWNLVSL